MIRTLLDQSPAELSEEDERILENVRRYGFITMSVRQSADDAVSRPGWRDVPDWTYTIGLYATYGHPELVAFTLEEEIVRSVCWDLAHEIKAGRKFESGTIYEDALPSFEGQPCAFDPVATEWLPELFGYGLWFYLNEPFPILQYIWPDNAGFFSWHPGASPALRDAQRDLTLAPRHDSEAPGRREIATTAWIGLVHIDGPPQHEALGGGLGAWVNVLALAMSRAHFEELVRSTLGADGLNVADIDSAEPLSDRLRGIDVEDELLALAHDLTSEEPVRFDSFYVYDQRD